MTLSDFSKKITSHLQPLYDAREAAAIAKIYLQERLHMPPHLLILEGGLQLSVAQLSQFEEELKCLSEGCPVQYVLGRTEFYGNIFEVTKDTLIPRPETEEMVVRVAQACSNSPNPHIWDVGTGSGCIAISLALMFPNAEVFATDISEAALTIARRNAERLCAPVRFACHDMCDSKHLPFAEVFFDHIVSNPPYIPNALRSQLHVNVRNYEPDSALFVPDEHPLIYYEAVANLALKALKPYGKCHVETFDDFHDDLVEMFQKKGFCNITTHNDLNERPRGVTAVKC